MEDEKPLASYEDWKGAVVTLYLADGKSLQKVEVIDLWMHPNGSPHELTVKHRGQNLCVPYLRVMYYKIIKRSQNLQVV